MEKNQQRVLLIRQKSITRRFVKYMLTPSKRNSVKRIYSRKGTDTDKSMQHAKSLQLRGLTIYFQSATSCVLIQVIFRWRIATLCVAFHANALQENFEAT